MYIKLFENFNIDNIDKSLLDPPKNLLPNGKMKFLYRTLRPSELFEAFYGPITDPQASMKYLLKVGKMPALPTLLSRPMLECCEYDGGSFSHLTTDWTIDPGYYYSVNEQYIRIAVDFDKVISMLGADNILDLLHDGEAEIRLRDDLPIMECLDHIEITRENFEEHVESEFSEHPDRAVRDWYPKEAIPYLRLLDGYMGTNTRDCKYCKPLENHYKKLFLKLGANIRKPAGFNLSRTHYFQ